MTIATGVEKRVAYKKQTALNTKATAGSAQILRRTTSDIQLTKNTFASAEIRDDFQIADFRHGVKSVSGTLNGELSPGSYADFFAAALRRDFTAVSDITTLAITITGSGAPYTVSRTAGSWLTDGVKVGDVVRLTAGSFDAANINKNLYVASVVALDITVYPLNSSAMTAEGPISSSTLSFPGKKTYVPLTSHTSDYFTFEHWHSDINVSKSFVDGKISTAAISIPASGMVTTSFGVIALSQDLDTSEYFTSPTAATTSGVTAGANGMLLIDGVKVGTLTGINFDINGNVTTEEVVFSESSPDVFPGSVGVTGQFSVLFENDTYLNMFADETEATIAMVLTTSNVAAADFVGFTMSRVKVGGNSEDDGQKGIIQTMPFTALLNVSGGAGTDSEETTISTQDSLA